MDEVGAQVLHDQEPNRAEIFLEAEDDSALKDAYTFHQISMLNPGPFSLDGSLNMFAEASASLLDPSCRIRILLLCDCVLERLHILVWCLVHLRLNDRPPEVIQWMEVRT